jgi:spermidine synthase
LGASLTGLSAAAGSAIVGILAWILDASRVPSRATTPAAGSGAPRRPARILLLLAFLSGLLTLAFEALAVRMLSQVHENSIHAFAVVLAVFLIALAGGAAGARAILRRGSRTSRLLGIAWMGAGVCLAIVPRLFFRITGGMSFIPGESGGRLLGIAVICIGPAAILCGAVLPLLMEMAGGEPGRHAGPALGRLLGANTAGAIAGPLLATFVLQPRLGLWWSLTAIGLTSAVAGEWALRDPRGGRIASLVRLAAIGSVVLMLRPGDVPRVGIVAGEKLLGMSEGSFGTVAVIEREGQRRIKLDNAYLIGGTASTGEERLQAHLPLLLHPAPRKVAFLGMGTGISAGAALLHPVEEVTVIEIVPEIIDAARVDFSEANLGIASDPRVHVILDDARHWLAGSRGSFDVIVGDLFVPWRRGESSLLTREQFESARRALAPGGIFCQWVPLYQMSREEFRIVLNTFLDVFPETTLWHGDMNAAEPAIGLIARAGGAPIDPASADARGRELARRLDPANPYLSDPAGLWLHLIGPIDRVDPWIAGARINRDDRPWIEMGTVEPGATDSSARGAVVGRSATALLDRLGGGPGAGSLETILGIERLRWRAAGRKLWEASILGREGRGRDADATGLEALASLPAALQLGVLGKVLCAADCPDPLATK